LISASGSAKTLDEEATVDRTPFEEHAFAKQAKDISSAAVFVSLVGGTVVWGLVLYDIFG